MEPVLLTSQHRSPEGAFGGDPWKHHPCWGSGAPRVGLLLCVVQALLPRSLLTTSPPHPPEAPPLSLTPSALPRECISGQGKHFSLNYPRLFLTGGFRGYLSPLDCGDTRVPLSLDPARSPPGPGLCRTTVPGGSARCQERPAEDDPGGLTQRPPSHTSCQSGRQSPARLLQPTTPSPTTPNPHTCCFNGGSSCVFTSGGEGPQGDEMGQGGRRGGWW